MGRQPKISVVLPSLNVVSYIRECVESVLKQTVKDIEVICVDAGSTDGTLEILREFEANDSRVKVLISDVKSYGHQMNMGVDAATGEYLGIVETDDWVVPNMYQSLYKIAKKNDLDFVKADFYRFTVKQDGSLEKKYNRLSSDASFYNRVLVPGEEIKTFKFIMNTWSGIYRLDFLRRWNIRHNETPGASYQDNGFWFMTFCRASRVMFIDKPYYMNRRDNPNSSVFSTSKVFCMRDEYDFIREQLEVDQDNLGQFIPLCNYFRFCGYYYNTIERISPDLRLDFLSYFSDEFRALADKNELDASLFSKKEWRDLQTIVFFPDRYLADTLKRSQPFSIKESYRSYRVEVDSSIRVSVIMPIFNVDKYLSQCLDSILAQVNAPQFEIICVNDGSTDSSAAILTQYAEKDNRITVLTQANAGVSSARNLGLSHAQGEYICFVDPDDALSPHALRRLVTVADKSRSDFVVFGFDPNYFPIERGETVPQWLLSKNPKRNHTFDSYSPQILFSEPGAKPFMWRNFIRRDFLSKNNIWFWENCRFGEDTVFQFEIFPNANRITFIKDKLYRYRSSRVNSLMDDRNNGSHLSKALSHVSVIAHLESVWSSEGFLSQSRIEFSEWAIDYFYDEFCECNDIEKVKLANEFMPVLRTFLSEKQQEKMGPGRQERIEDIRSFALKAQSRMDFQLRMDTDLTPAIARPRERSIEEEPYLSIVVPVHNNERTIEGTLSSLVQQSLESIEIICVDDASNDGSRALIEAYAQKDKRISVITYSENRSASQARKDAVLVARGRFILFCDGDDTLVPEACELLKNEMDSCPVDVLHFGINVLGDDAFEEDRRWIESNTLPFEGKLLGQDVFFGCYRAHLYGFNLWNKMISASVAKRAFECVEDGSFPRGQDVYAYTLIAYFAQSYRGVPGLHLYNYHLGSGLDGTKTLDMPTFTRFCSLSLVVDALRRFFETQGIFNVVADIWFELRARILGDCINKWYKKVADSEKGEAFDEMLRTWPAWLVVDAVARRYWNSPKVIFRNLETSCTHSIVKKHPKTIAMYYHKLVGGGVERVIQLLAPLWIDMGYEVLIITDVQGPDDFIALPEEVRRVSIPNAGTGNMDEYITRVHALDEIIRRNHVDVMVYHAWNTGLLPWDMLAMKALGTSFIVHCHNIFSMRLLSAQAYFSEMPAIFEFADAVICLSEVDRAFWHQFNGNVHVVINPIESSFCDCLPAEDDGRSVLWVGRLESEKRPEELLRIFALVHQRCPEARLRILGAGKTDEAQVQLERRAEQLGIADFVEFLGFQNDVLPFFQKATVYVGTSEYEGFSLATFEALASGVPVVMYELPYLMLVRGNDGVIQVPSGNAFAVADEIVRLLEDDKERAARSEAAYSFAQKVLQYDYKDAWQAIFDSLAKDRGPVSLGIDDALMWDTLLNHYALGVQKLNGKCNYLQRQLGSDGKSEVDRIHASASYKIGRFFTWPARKVRTLVNCYKEHGLNYTLDTYLWRRGR